MNILAIDTSGVTAGVALLQDRNLLAEVFLNVGRNHSEVLLPSMDQLLTAAGLKLVDVDAFACTVGPGSFTGIRIGVSTVKGLALAFGRPVVALSALEVLASAAVGVQRMICPMIDAKKEQVYAASYTHMDGESLTRIIPEQLVKADDFLNMITGEAVFIGTGALKYGDAVRRRLGDRGCFAAHHLHQVRAAAVGALAVRKAAAGELTDAVKLVPLYLRRSEAEERDRRG